MGLGIFYCIAGKFGGTKFGVLLILVIGEFVATCH